MLMYCVPRDAHCKARKFFVTRARYDALECAGDCTRSRAGRSGGKATPTRCLL